MKKKKELIEIIDSNEKHFKNFYTVYCQQYILYLVSNDELSTNHLGIIKKHRSKKVNSIYLKKKDFPEAWLNLSLLYQMHHPDDPISNFYFVVENCCSNNLLIIERRNNYLNGNDLFLKMLIE